MRIVSAAFCCVLFSTSLFAQLTVESQSAIQLSGLETAETIGTAVFVTSDAAVGKEPVILITADSEAANIAFEVSDLNRTPVEFEQLTPRIIVVRSPGKSWVDVTAIDFAKNIYARKLVVIELGDKPDPPDPDKPDPKPPLPPDGPFDALAVKVAVIAAQMATSERDTLTALLRDTADKMRRFEFKTLDQARDYVEASWTKTEPAKQLQTLLSQDAASRLLSWEQAQKYYLEIVKGLQ